MLAKRQQKKNHVLSIKSKPESRPELYNKYTKTIIQCKNKYKLKHCQKYLKTAEKLDLKIPEHEL